MTLVPDLLGDLPKDELARLARALTQRLERHRILFWYDEDSSFAASIDALALEGVEIIRLANNEFGVKYRILREAPKARFLLYREGPRPADIDNWLLDVELAHGVFRTDQIAMWLEELGLPPHFDDLLREHAEFFRSAKRRERFKTLMPGELKRHELQLAMLSAGASVDRQFDSVVEVMLAEMARGQDDTLRLFERAKLTDFFWGQMARRYGYDADKPSVGDFAIQLFKSAYADAVGDDVELRHEATVFFKRWKNNRNNAAAFTKLAGDYAEVLGIERDAADRTPAVLAAIDFFEPVDRALIKALVREVVDRTSSPGQIETWLRQRRQSHWFQTYADFYRAIGYAAKFHEALSQAALGMQSLREGIERYARTWSRIDYLYRKFVLHKNAAGQASLMGALAEQVEQHYANSYLLALNDAWQVQVEGCERWRVEGVLAQTDFFRHKVRKYRHKGQKVCVIICDALRYEIAHELLSRVRQLDRYDAGIEPMLGVLPSYTQLGMAALLPHKAIAIADDGSAATIDGLSTRSLAERTRVLAAGAQGDRTTALKAGELLELNKDASRALFRDHEIIYVYQDIIDATGDQLKSETRVFEAVEDALEDLIKLVKKLANANAANILVTADHGFLYQHECEEGDFAIAEAKGEQLLQRNRRFVTGHGLAKAHGLRHFTSEALGLVGDIEVLVPNSINRLRVKGSGSRYVHGGASLQEVVVPLVSIRKSRSSDVAKVEVDIIASLGNKLITTSQLAIVLYQTAPVSEKVQPRRLRVGIYAKSGELLSDIQEESFGHESSNARDRERRVRLLLSREADEFDGQEVFLRLDEQHGDTSHYQAYRSVSYTLRRTFGGDFDF